MSKSAKKTSKRENAGAPGRETAARPAPGQLIALEGTRGKDLEEAALKTVRLFDSKPGAGLSRFDSSNTFFELRLAKGKRGSAPPRTLVLLYASDLLFRLRWEIRPALLEGRTVIAAPYVQTAIGFGLAAGLSKEWLQELFAFATPADATFRLKEKRKTKDKGKTKRGNGYIDFCFSNLAAISPQWTYSDVRCKILDYLEEECHLEALTKKLPKKLLKRSTAQS